MKQIFLSLCLLVLCTVAAKGGETVLSPYCRFSVLTCDPGTEPYAIFGHSAIRVYDSLSHVDAVFNYGTFDFDDPNFYTKFLQGRLTYFLSTASFEDFLQEYRYNHQRVREQVLNLQPQEVVLLWNKLIDNLKEENKYYKYDFFYDNCSTRIRDVIKTVGGNNWQVKDNGTSGTKSFRQEITPYFVNNSFTGFGIDVSIGLPADKHPTQAERMFLPSNLYDAIDHSTIGAQKLVSTLVVYDFRDAAYGLSVLNKYSSLVACCFLLAIAVLVAVLEMRFKRRLLFFDYFIFGITGFIGIGLVGLWFFTDHSVTKFNQNLLWACPLSFIALFTCSRYRRTYFYYYSIVLGALIIAWLFVARYFDVAVLPIIITLFSRSIGLIKYNKNTSTVTTLPALPLKS